MKDKTCSRCNQKQSIQNFYVKTERNGKKTYQSWCKICCSERHKEYYAKNKDKFIKKGKSHKAKTKEYINSFKNKPCMDCGESYPYYVMDFDHRDPAEKEFNVSVLRRGWGKDRILAEIQKCDLVCANCHRERTFGTK